MAAPLFFDEPISDFEDKRLVFCLWPRKCKISGESLWLKKAWRVRFEDWASREDRWYCEREYMWKVLKEA
jgi:hypothetical protein